MALQIIVTGFEKAPRSSCEKDSLRIQEYFSALRCVQRVFYREFHREF